MSFYTSLTGLNASTAELAIVSNNIANVGTIGFKKSRAEFGDIFATSPLQNAASSIGQGVLLKGVAQEFSQGNVAFSQNSLDMAIQGQGFFVLKPNLTSNQTVYTRNGSFRVNNDRYVVDSSGQFVQVFPVNDDGSVVATGLDSAKSLQLPTTAGLPQASSKIDLGVNLPADAEIITKQTQYTSGAAVYRFDRNDPSTFNRSTSITVFDSLGNPSIATIYYVKSSNATIEDPTNKWQTFIYVGDREIKPALLPAKTDKSEPLYIDKFGQSTTDPTLFDPTFNATAAHPLYYLNDQNKRVDSKTASFVGGIMNTSVGFDFGSTDSTKIQLGKQNISTTYSGTYTPPISAAAGEVFKITLNNGTATPLSIGVGGRAIIAKGEATTQTAGSATVAKIQTLNLTAAALNTAGAALSPYTAAYRTSLTVGNTVLSTSADVANRAALVTALQADADYADAAFTVAASATVGNTTDITITWKTAGVTTNSAVMTIVDSTANSAVAGIGLYDGVSTAANETVKAVAIDKALATARATTELAAQGIGFTGSALAGNLTFFDSNSNTLVSANTFNLAVTNSYTSTTGGFAGEEFANNVTDGTEIGTLTAANQGLSTRDLLKISIDGSDPLTISLPDELRGTKVTGTQLASELSKAINNAFSDEQYLDIDTTNNQFRITATIDIPTTSTDFLTTYVDPYVSGTTSPNYVNTGRTIAAALEAGITIKLATGATYTPSTLVAEAQTQIDANIGAAKMKVGYDARSRALTFKPYSNLDKIQSLKVSGPNISGVDKANETLGLDAVTDFVAVGASPLQGTLIGAELQANGEYRLNEDQRRYGIQVIYLKDQRKFEFRSGTTGETSLIKVEAAANLRAGNIFGVASDFGKEFVTTTGTGLKAKPAVTNGFKTGIDVSGTFLVTLNDNVVNVTVDGIDGTIRVPVGAYTATTYASALERRINQISTADGRSVNGVKVKFDTVGSRFIFESGTTSVNSLINVNGHPNFGLDRTTQVRGEVPKVTVLQQAKDTDGNSLYIDKDGNETTAKPENMPNYAPIYLSKGQLTFDTAGKLVSPKEGAQYTPFDPQNGADLIVLNVDYGRFSTQYSQPFSVLSLSQDGFGSGRLDGISIDSAGVVKANYTNGKQQALGKIILANFASPNGLKQIGNANYVATSNSGSPSAGEAGSDGFGSIQGGALERANVDLTEELVQLITSQRNFQANAKAIETATNLTSTIVNIRG